VFALAKSTSRLALLKQKHLPQLPKPKKTQLRTKKGDWQGSRETIPNLEVEGPPLNWKLSAELNLNDTVREERIREASKPLYLKRYE
jgi:hypothetical protein